MRHPHDRKLHSTKGRMTVSALMIAVTVLMTQPIPAEAGTTDAKKGSVAVKRDPFWPVGYTPKGTQIESQASSVDTGGSTWAEAMKKVVINGVSSRSDAEYCAVINGELKTVGETVSIRLGGSVYTWAVDSIEPPGSVKLRRVSVR